jgi:hypothetical protein
MHYFGEDENMTVVLKIWNSVTNYYCLKTDAKFVDACCCSGLRDLRLVCKILKINRRYNATGIP